MGYFNTKGEEIDEEAPGPRGQRMMQLGILTKKQRKPKLPGALASPAAQTLAEKVAERNMAALQTGVFNKSNEADPMKTSTVIKPPQKRVR